MSLKGRLASRQPPQTTVRLRMEFSPASDDALADLAAADADLESAKARGLADLAGYERAVRNARATAETFYETLTVRSLPPDRMDELVEKHPATADQKANTEGIGWNPDTFPAALLAACVDSDMTEDDWHELIHSGPVSGGEVRLLVNTAFDINDRSPNPDLGKG